MNTKSKKTHGFTLFEVLIVVAIIAILAILAIPVYYSGQQKAKFLNVVKAAESKENSVAEKIYSKPGVSGCCTVETETDATDLPQFVSKLTVSTDGVIQAYGSTNAFSATETDNTYTLTPAEKGNVIKWTSSCGTGVTNYCTAHQ